MLLTNHCILALPGEHSNLTMRLLYMIENSTLKPDKCIPADWSSTMTTAAVLQFMQHNSSAGLEFPAHTCTFYMCPLLWLPGYEMDSKATVSELGVFNLPQSLRACASAHVIHHVDQNVAQTNGASAFCGASVLQSLVRRTSIRGYRPSDHPEERWPSNYTAVDIRHLNWPPPMLLSRRLLFCWVSKRPHETIPSIPGEEQMRSCWDKPDFSGEHEKGKCGTIELQQ